MRWIEKWRVGDESLLMSEGWNPRPEPPSVVVALRNGVESVEDAIAADLSKKEETCVKDGGVVGNGDLGRREGLYRRTVRHLTTCAASSYFQQPLASRCVMDSVDHCITPTKPRFVTLSRGTRFGDFCRYFN